MFCSLFIFRCLIFLIYRRINKLSKIKEMLWFFLFLKKLQMYYHSHLMVIYSSLCLFKWYAFDANTIHKLTFASRSSGGKFNFILYYCYFCVNSGIQLQDKLKYVYPLRIERFIMNGITS